MSHTQQLWCDFLRHAKAKCSSVAFNNWLAPIKLGESSDTILELEVPNLYVQEYLVTNFHDDLKTFLNALDVRFKVIDSPEKKEAPKIMPQKVAVKSCNLKLNPLYTFNDFIEGPENAFVKSCAQSISKGSYGASNPLFLYSNPGLGKTHLLHSIAKEAKELYPKKRIQCVSTEAFINELVANLKGKTVDRMKRWYRDLDILLIDDLQFLENRLNFEEELVHTFEALFNTGKQVVVASDKAPCHLKLSARIIGRMEGGLVAPVNVPGLETRAAILQRKASLRGLTLPYDAALMLAENLVENVRQLEGAVNRLSAFAQMNDQTITCELAKNLMQDLFEVAPTKKVTIDAVIQASARACNVSVADIRGSSRKRLISFARAIAMHLAKEMTAEPITLIAAAFGGRTHSTLLHAHGKIAKEKESDPGLRSKLRAIQSTL